VVVGLYRVRSKVRVSLSLSIIRPNIELWWRDGDVGVGRS